MPLLKKSCQVFVERLGRICLCSLSKCARHSSFQQKADPCKTGCHLFIKPVIIINHINLKRIWL